MEKLEDKDISTFLPKLGDRIALKLFLEGNKPTKKMKKSSILQSLREKMGIQGKRNKNPNSSSDEGTSASSSTPKKTKKHMARVGNKSAMKEKKKVEVGWIHEGKQVRSPRGGGTRKIDLPKQSTKDSILEEVKPLFFPNGNSQLGKVEDFDFTLADFSQRDIDEQTIDELYSAAKMSTLRLYVVTKRKDGSRGVGPKDDVNDSSSSGDELPDPLIDAETEIATKGTNSIADSTPSVPDDTRPITSTPQKVNSEDEPAVRTILLQDLSEGNLAASAIQLDLVLPQDVFAEAVAVPNDYAASSLLMDIQNYDPDIIIGQSAGSNDDQDTTVPQSDCYKKLVIRRGNAFIDIMKYFMSNDFNIRTDILEIGILTERGEDSGGVFRDAMSEFWETFYLKHTDGADVKIPTTVHIMKQEEWEAVGKVLVLSYKQEKYFPIQLSKMFLQKCIFNYTPTEEDLILSFLSFLPEIDRVTVKDALDNFGQSDEAELIEALSNFHLRVYPTKDNLRKLITEVAHHELIQKPSFVTLCWSSILSTHLKYLITSLEEVYDQCRVSNKKVLNALEFPEELTKAEKATVDALKRYIKTCSLEKLGMFLRFCTGSDILIGKK